MRFATSKIVIPAKAGTQLGKSRYLEKLGPGLRRGDGIKLSKVITLGEYQCPYGFFFASTVFKAVSSAFEILPCIGRP